MTEMQLKHSIEGTVIRLLLEKSVWMSEWLRERTFT